MSLARRLFLLSTLAACTGSVFAANAHRAVVSKVPPIYPELARRMHVSGTVVVHLVVAPDGSVTLVEPDGTPRTSDLMVDVNFSGN